MKDRDPSAADGPPMSAPALQEFMARPLIARLATSLGDRPRILPMWFRWDGSCLWMETSPTFPNYRVLKQNPHAAVAIDESAGGLRLRAVIMRGTVDIIEGPDDVVHGGVRRIYERYLSPEEMRGPGTEMMTSAGHVLLCLTPASLATWDTTASDREGYAPAQ